MPRRASAKKKMRLDSVARSRALEALHLMRSRGLRIGVAAKETHTTPRTIRKYLGNALKIGPSRRIVPTASDRYTRTLRFLTPQGQIQINVRDSRTASKIAEYWSAVDHYLKTGDTRRLRSFRKQSIRAGKMTYPFITDVQTLKRLGYAGEVQFEDLYAYAA
jgi:hypothetical protein